MCRRRDDDMWVLLLLLLDVRRRVGRRGRAVAQHVRAWNDCARDVGTGVWSGLVSAARRRRRRRRERRVGKERNAGKPDGKIKRRVPPLWPARILFSIQYLRCCMVTACPGSVRGDGRRDDVEGGARHGFPVQSRSGWEKRVFFLSIIIVDFRGEPKFSKGKTFVSNAAAAAAAGRVLVSKNKKRTGYQSQPPPPPQPRPGTAHSTTASIGAIPRPRRRGRSLATAAPRVRRSRVWRARPSRRVDRDLFSFWFFFFFF